MERPAVSGNYERRREPRVGLKVVHRHRVGSAVRSRTSELVYVKGRPVAIVDWINLGGVRTPLYVCELDPDKLHPTSRPHVHEYEDVTCDPRFLDSIGG